MDASALSDYLLDITPDDVQESKKIWKNYAGRKSMVDFLGSEYALDNLQYYRVYMNKKKPGLRKIPYTTVKNDIIRYGYGVRKEHRILTQALINETIPAQDWYQQTLYLTKISLWATFTIAEGGYNRFREQERVDRWLLMALPVLTSFNLRVEQLRAGTRELNGRLLLDADILGDSTITTFENFRLNYAVNHGARKGKRVTSGGEICHDRHDRRGCIELAARGYEPIWKVVPIGQAACFHKCRCYIEYLWEGD